MAVFVAGADESVSGDASGEFFFGGFVAPESDWWESFTPAWQERVLSTRPRLEYLHVTELKSPKWRREHGLREIDAERKLDEAFRLIRDHESLYPVTAYLNADHFRAAIKRAKLKLMMRTPGGIARKRFDPDYLCFSRFAINVLQYVREAHSDAEKVSFIIEDNGPITRYIQRFHRSMPRVMNELGRPDLGQLIGDLIPANKRRVPLQAADLLCWYSRNRQNLSTADHRRYECVATRAGIMSLASEDHVDELVDDIRLARLTDDDAGDEDAAAS